ncbi:hypothetical protein GYMLUDRAFT_251722 [Collybiopsis luxurians FD-317 M1]|uniref:Uncharacterized protein n=1 Tax=Collybiopsis luxurians FD-317 M1 TaxID=944289 RepID=A0A0D0BBQ3_9AGAR|nr:hypothetical protein GYMLUDRAFT_251722 [Collybiopsis luxurians FD-317 M1]
MSLSQLFTDQPIVLSSNSGGSKPQLIIKVLQTLQSASLVPFSNALPSAPPAAKKMRHVAFECSTHLSYPSISITDCIPSSLPTSLQPIYKDAYLTNSSPKVLDRVAANEWKKELGLALDRPRAPEGKRKAVVSSNAFQKSQLLRQERVHLGEPSRKPVVLASSHKGKEVVHDPIDVDVEMEAPEELDAMNLDYPEEAPPPPTPIPTAPAPVSSLKTWFFEPLVKQVPSNGSSLTWDKMVQTAIEHVVTRMALLFAGPGRKMLEQDLWALVDGMIQGTFTGLEEQLQHSPSKPPASFSSKSLLQFVESLTITLTQLAECTKAKNLQLKEQVSSWDSQLKEKDEELTCLKSFVRHFKGDIQSSETQQLRGAMESQDSEIEELKKKLAASEEAH